MTTGRILLSGAAAAASLLLAGCVSYQRPSPPVYIVAPGQCRHIETTAMIDGRSQPISGTACPQPDGSWRFVP